MDMDDDADVELAHQPGVRFLHLTSRRVGLPAYVGRTSVVSIPAPSTLFCIRYRSFARLHLPVHSVYFGINGIAI